MLTVGQIFENNYRIDARIGSGGGGIIYKAYQISMQRYVALKLIKENVKHLLSDRSEADILKMLKHKNLPSVFDFIRDGDDVYTVMEFIDGQDFDKLIKSGKRYTEKETLKYAAQLCDAVNYLHSQDPPIIHSDIKPANIMLMPNDEICLIDFNISTYLNSANTRAVGHSKYFSAYEQTLDYRQVVSVPQKVTEFSEETRLVGFDDDLTEIQTSSQQTAATEMLKAVIDMRTDIYGMGATLYYIATGRLPKGKKLDFDGTDISPRFQAVLNKATQMLPENRYRSAEKMLADIEKINKKSYTGLKIAGVLCIAGLVAVSGYQAVRLHREESAPKVSDVVENAEDYPYIIMGGVRYDKTLTEMNLKDKGVSADELYMLGEVKGLQKLSLDGIDLSGADMSFMVQLTSLDTLSMAGCGLEKIDFLSHNTALTTLDIKENELTSLDFVSELTELVYLCADNNAVGNGLSPLEALDRLQVLYLDSNGITDIAPVSELTELRELTLNQNSITDISPLSSLADLESLYIGGNSISDISPLSGLTGMKKLDISQNMNIGSVEPLSEMNRLEFLNISVNNVRDVSPLSGKKYLTNLWAADNNITDISPLAGDKNIASLILKRNDIDDISVLSEMKDMVDLSLGQNSISDISALEGLELLRTVDLSRNSVSDFSPLYECTSLKTLNIIENGLSDEQIAEIKKALPECEVK